MPTTESDALKPLEVLVADIRELHGTIERLAQQFRELLAQAGSKQPFDLAKQSGPYWRCVAYTDSLARLRLFLEPNFNFIESMVLLAVARYLFELTVWLKLMRDDGRYGLVYYIELAKNQLDHYKALRNHLIQEVAFLRGVGVKEKELLDARLKSIKAIVDAEERKRAALRLGTSFMQDIDRTAVRRFSLYGEAARTNGYGLQAHLVETRVMPQAEKCITDLERELQGLERDIPKGMRKLVPGKWKWKQQAKNAGMEDEYEFIYSYTSRLLHATPASLTKNLEPDEMRVFLKYIHVRLLDVIELAKELLPTD